MNNLHRELAPISDAAWAQIEEETSRTLKRYLAGRRVVDVHGPRGDRRQRLPGARAREEARQDEIIWAPAIDGAFVLTTRGGDFDLHIGQDVSIGYLSHTDSAVRLYLQETLTFLMLTSESAVALAPRAVTPPT